MRPLLSLCLVALLAACSVPPRMEGMLNGISGPPPGDPPPAPTLDPTPPPPPPEGARTVEAFDTTTDEDRADATATGSGTEAALGTTVAALGDAGDPGFWVATALVDELTAGRVSYGASGLSVNVDLRPKPEGGAEISLAAMRVLEAPLTELIEIEVFELLN